MLTESYKRDLKLTVLIVIAIAKYEKKRSTVNVNTLYESIYRLRPLISSYLIYRNHSLRFILTSWLLRMKKLT